MPLLHESTAQTRLHPITPMAPQELPARGSGFESDLLTLLPMLKGFSLHLTDARYAEDLVQDTLARAWKARAAFEAGTNLKAWLFTIMRNVLVSDHRRAWRTVPLDPLNAENMLVAHEDAAASEDLSDLGAMQRLPEMQRKLLQLAGSAGLSYAEISPIMGCPVGQKMPRSGVFDDMMIEAANLSRGGALSMSSWP
jgi:RNA polymerase sigma-70 factor (ECF subfamily)